ncbi:MAG: protein kinase, partial [Thermoanaerobaculia bacterium]|nr:protein kinase [Thermoanaerobaculia bacterium]
MTQELAQRIRFRETIGESNYAITRLAYDPELGKRVVVKTLELSRVDDEKVVELFRREARVLANLDHPRIPKFVGVYDERDENGRRLNLVQQHVDGVDLERVIEAGRHFTEAEVIRIGSELSSILAYLHGFSPPIIHRDIKPSNIILDANDEVWLVD